MRVRRLALAHPLAGLMALRASRMDRSGLSASKFRPRAKFAGSASFMYLALVSLPPSKFCFSHGNHSPCGISPVS